MSVPLEVHLALRTDCHNVFRLVGENQRLKTAPRVGHAEQAEVIQIRGQLLIIEFLIQYKGEQAAAAGEITFPEFMPSLLPGSAGGSHATCGWLASHSRTFKLLSWC